MRLERQMARERKCVIKKNKTNKQTKNTGDADERYRKCLNTIDVTKLRVYKFINKTLRMLKTGANFLASGGN